METIYEKHNRRQIEKLGNDYPHFFFMPQSLYDKAVELEMEQSLNGWLVTENLTSDRGTLI